MSLVWWTTERAAIALAAVAFSVQWVLTQRQLRQASRAAELDGMLRVIELLQSKEARADRRYLLTTPPDLTSATYRDAADNAGQRFEQVAFLIQAKLVKKDLVLDNWAYTIIKTWSASRLLIEQRRERDQEAWIKFTWLKDEANVYRARRGIPVSEQPAAFDL